MKHLPFVDRFESWGHSSLLESMFPKIFSWTENWCWHFQFNIPNTKPKKMSAESPWTFAATTVAGSPSSVKESTEIVYLQTWHPNGEYYHQETYITISSIFCGVKKISHRKKNQKRMAKYFWFSWDGNWTTETDLEYVGQPPRACMARAAGRWRDPQKIRKRNIQV